MKTKETITTDKATVLVCELPEGVEPKLQGPSHRPAISKNQIPQGNWQLIGRIPDITECQWEEIVDFHDKPDGYFRNYLYHTIQAPHIWKKSATESGLSLLQANEVYFENPLREKPIGCSVETYHTRKEWSEEWQEAQSKVFDKERTYLFIKVD